MTVIRARVAVILGLAILLAAAFAGYQAFWPVTVKYAHAGFAYDVDDRRQVSGYADHIIVGSAETDGSTRAVAGPPQTTYRIRVVEELKGRLGSNTVDIIQSGVDLEGKEIWLLEGVEPIVRGGTYILALKVDRDHGLMLLNGPHSPRSVPDTNARAGVSGEWREAIRNQRWPDALR